MFGDQPHQRDQPDLRIHVQRAATPLERQQRTNHRQRHRHHDDQRVDEALELRRQHQEDEHQRQHKHHAQRTLRVLELARGVVQVGGVAGLEHLGGRLVHEGDGLAQRVVGRQVGRDGGRAALAKVVQLARAHALAHVDQAGQRDDRVIAAAHVDGVDVFGRGAAPRLGLHDHVVLLGIAFVTCEGAAAQHGLDGLGHHFHAHTQVGGAFAVDLDAQLGLVQAQVHVGGHDAGVLSNLGHERGHHLAQVFVAVRGLDHVGEGPRAKALAERRRCDQKGVHAGQARHLGLQLLGQGQRGAVALFPVHGAVDHAALCHRGVADVGKHAVEFGVGVADLFQLQRIAVGVVQRSAVGRSHAGQNGAPVFQRRQLLPHAGEHQHQRRAAQGHDAQHNPAGLEQRTPHTAPPRTRAAPAGRDDPAQQTAIGVRQGREPALHGAVEPVGLRVVLEQQ